MKGNLLKLLVPLVLILFAATGCASQQTGSNDVIIEPESVEIRISGAGGTTGVLKALAEEYSKSNSDISFKFLEGSGSSGGVRGVNENLLDLGAMSRSPKESELETGIRYFTFAQERVAVVTSPDLPLSNLTEDQVRGIFSGEIDNWSSVGGPDVDIRLITREESDSNTKVMRQGILGELPFGDSALEMSSEADARDALENATHAIGYLAYSGVLGYGLSVHPVALSGSHPADENVDYPIPPRRLGVAFMPEKADAVQKFVDFITSSSVKGFLANQGLLAVK